MGHPFEIFPTSQGGEASGPLEIDEVEDAGPVRRSPMRAVMYAVWIAMAVAFSVLRACTEQPG